MRATSLYVVLLLTLIGFSPTKAAAQRVAGTPQVSIQAPSPGDCQIHVMEPPGAAWNGELLLDDEPVRHDLQRRARKGGDGTITVLLLEALRPDQVLRAGDPSRPDGWSDKVVVPRPNGLTRDPAAIECVGGYPRDKRQLLDVDVR